MTTEDVRDLPWRRYAVTFGGHRYWSRDFYRTIMSENVLDQVPANSAGKRSPGPRRSVLVLAIAFIVAFVTAPFWVLMLAFWAAEGSWDFDSSNGFRYWLFVKGSRLERLGFVEQTGSPANYSVRLQEGTFPGWIVLGYESRALPADIMTAYANRCRAMSLRVMDTTPPADPAAPHKLHAELDCEIEPYLNAEFLPSAHRPRPPRGYT